MKNCQRLPNATRDISPCAGCTEKFTACHDRCPKDARGEYGYDAWRAEIKRVKQEKQKYLDRTNVRKKTYTGGNYGQE
jgi:Fe-S-cluster-containing dehydrogenase component